MKRYKLIVKILLLFICSACAIVKGPEIKFDRSRQSALFSSGFKPNETGRLKTSGYYLLFDVDCANYLKGQGFRLWDDGAVSNIYFGLIGVSEELLSGEIMDAVIEAEGVSFRDGNYGYSMGGIYKIEGDTLIIDRYFQDDGSWWHDYWTMEKKKYKIIDNGLFLMEISSDSCCGQDEIRKKFCGDRVFRFVPASMFMNERFLGVKDAKWMWEDEAEWKTYRREWKEWRKKFLMGVYDKWVY